jgi:chromosome segregation ATPase
MKTLAAAMVVVLGCGVMWGQGSAAAGSPAMTDSQTLQAILVEMRGIHNDVRLSQTTQILLTEMEVQRGVVDKATEKRDNARGRVTQLQTQEKNFAAEIPRLEESAKTTLDPVQQKRFADQIENMKSNIENFKNQGPDAANVLADAENALRKEQETLSGIQGELDAVVKQLQPAGK